MAVVAIAADVTTRLRLLAPPEALKTCEPKALRWRLLSPCAAAPWRPLATLAPAQLVALVTGAVATFTKVMAIDDAHLTREHEP